MWVFNRKLALQKGLLEASLHKIGQHKPSCGTTSINKTDFRSLKSKILALEPELQQLIFPKF
jgi:hypothetical protein